VKHNAAKRPTKLITSLNAKLYWPSGILSHRQNSYALRSRLCTGHREAQSREPVNKGKNLRVLYWGSLNAYNVKMILKQMFMM
jgi:hypothetical protein